MFRVKECDLCGDCLVRCQYVDYDRERSIAEFSDLMNGNTPPIVTLCVSCVACNNYCTKGANPFDLILQRQEETGVLNIPEANTQLFRNLPKMPGEVIEGEKGKPLISLCSVGDLIPELFEGPLFEKATILKGGDFFCSVGWIHLGQEKPVRDNAQRFLDNIGRITSEEVVFYHDDCYALAKAMAPSYGLEVPFKPLHIFDFLLDAVKGFPERPKPLEIKVAYQQPCASRYTPEKDAVLDELFKLIGVERVNRKHDRMEALCCGSPLMPRDRDRALNIKETNLADAAGACADAMAYLCPLCYLNLNKLAAEKGLENYHVIELVKESLGL